MKYKILNSKIEKDNTGTKYVVEISTNVGHFTGVAKVHPEDINKQNRFSGYIIAENKAYRKALEKDLKGIKKILKYIPYNDANKTVIANLEAKINNLQREIIGITIEIIAECHVVDNLI